MEFFYVAHYEFNDEFSKFKIADRVLQTKGEKLPNFNRNWSQTFWSCGLRICFYIFQIEDGASTLVKEK